MQIEHHGAGVGAAGFGARPRALMRGREQWPGCSGHARRSEDAGAGRARLGHLQGRRADSRRADEGAGRRNGGGLSATAAKTSGADAVAVLDEGYYNDPEAVLTFLRLQMHCRRSSAVHALVRFSIRSVLRAAAAG